MTWNYLRVRGEYQLLKTIFSMVSELPPRARRIPEVAVPPQAMVGTTSACAENTAFDTLYFTPPWNYLRVRGEYTSTLPAVSVITELPPRARRILLPNQTLRVFSGTTSACAENTPTMNPVSNMMRNYLRVRGEYVRERCARLRPKELPPRARRIRNLNKQRRRRDGTTSACAENTFCRRSFCFSVRNYLRVRGEYIIA